MRIFTSKECSLTDKHICSKISMCTNNCITEIRSQVITLTLGFIRIYRKDQFLFQVQEAAGVSLSHSLYEHACICMCVCLCVCKSACGCTCKCLCIQMCTVCRCVWPRASLCMCACSNARVCVCVCVCMHVCACLCVHACTCLHACAQVGVLKS
uniref:Uncharacterized protein n=1 Tax=Anguilla anguilla TaxID=7936 RepID=A0A0E9X3Y9_ANGAN